MAVQSQYQALYVDLCTTQTLPQSEVYLLDLKSIRMAGEGG